MVYDGYYATISELIAFSLNPQVVKNYTFTEISMNAALLAASAEVNSYLTSQQILPLTDWDAKIKQVTCDIAAYRLFKQYGYDPDAIQNSNIRSCYNQAMEWLNKVADQMIIVKYPDSDPSPMKAGPFVRPNSSFAFGPINCGRGGWNGGRWE